MVAAIQHGDEQAFEGLFKEYYAPLCGYANKLIKDMDDAEEIVQSVLFKVWERREALEISVSVKAYLYRAVHNACLNYFKHEKVKQEHATHVSTTQTEGVEDTSLEQKELRNQITEAIDQLPEKCQEVFRLNKLEGLKYKEVALILGISEKTVENQMGKALKVLREKLAPLVNSVWPWVLFFLLDVGGKWI